MARSQEHFSAQQHQDVADLLVRVREELQHLGADMGRSYGETAEAAARNAIAAVDRVRQMLDEQLDRDFPRDNANPSNIKLGSVYYPPRWSEHRKAG